MSDEDKTAANSPSSANHEKRPSPYPYESQNNRDRSLVTALVAEEAKEKSKLRNLIWFVPMMFVLGCLLGWGGNVVERMGLSPEGGPDPFFACGFWVGLAMMGTCFVVPVTFIMVVPKKTRPVAAFMITGCVAFWSGYVPIKQPSPRMEAFEKLGERLTPLVEAIERYHEEKGEYPRNLYELVPEYIKELPSTEMGNYKGYRYLVGEKANEYDGNPWVIIMNAGYAMGFDRFMYFPLQNYPKRGYGGSLQRLGKWAYVHE